jgi:hypothetical protein
MIYVKSTTSGNILPAQVLKVSLFRQFFGMSHIKLSVVGTNLDGINVTSGWYNNAAITCVSSVANDCADDCANDCADDEDYIIQLEDLLKTMADSIKQGLSLLDKSRLTMTTPKVAVGSLSEALSQYKKVVATND